MLKYFFAIYFLIPFSLFCGSDDSFSQEGGWKISLDRSHGDVYIAPQGKRLFEGIFTCLRDKDNKIMRHAQNGGWKISLDGSTGDDYIMHRQETSINKRKFSLLTGFIWKNQK